MKDQDCQRVSPSCRRGLPAVVTGSWPLLSQRSPTPASTRSPARPAGTDAQNDQFRHGFPRASQGRDLHTERRIRSGPGFCPQSHYVIILAISRQCAVVANVQMPSTVNTANAHHHERELLHTRCLCTPTMAYAVPSRKRLRTSVGLSRFPDGARAGFIRYSLAPLNCWPGHSAGNTRPRGRRTARG